MAEVVWTDKAGAILFACRVPKSLLKRVKLDAFEAEVTVSEWISDALAAHLERCTGGEPAKAVAIPTR